MSTNDIASPSNDPSSKPADQFYNDVQSAYAIGIDLGTTNSLVAVYKDGASKLVPNALGSYLTPSVVSVEGDGTVLVGRAAKNRQITHPQATVHAFKRYMGSDKRFNLEGKVFAPEDLSALVLQSLKLDAQAFLGCEVRNAVISVPAYFNDAQRKATQAAAHIAGLEVLRLINEPTAASLAHGLHQSNNETKFLVFDLGGGTFDVSVVELFEGIIEVKSSTGDNQLGGEDFTAALIKWMEQQLQAQGLTLPFLTQPFQRAAIYNAAEKAKQSMAMQKAIDFSVTLDGKSYALKLTEEALDKACDSLIVRLRKPVERAVRDARIDLAELSEVVLVGGASRMPSVRKAVSRMFGRFPNVHVNPDETIALGAAIQAGLVMRHAALDEVMMTDVCPYSLGIEVSQEQGDGSRVEGIFSPIIERNTVVPTSKVNSFSPFTPKQKSILAKVYQGESRFVKDNIYLGEIDVPLAPGDEGIDVRFTYDVSGLLEVDVTTRPRGIAHALTLLGLANTMTEAEIQLRKKALNTLKIHPRDDMPNKALTTRLDRLYAERSGMQRESIGRTLTDFTLLLAAQNLTEIARQRVRLSEWCDQLEADSPLLGESDED
jgi:molecular chaperone HscC